MSKIPAKAIELAIKGGWQNQVQWDFKLIRQGLIEYHAHGKDPNDGFTEVTSMEIATVALDPTFWQALGKRCGWDDIVGGYHGNFNTNLKCVTCNAHRFYDLVLIGQSTDLFWQEILGKENNHE